MAAARPFVSTAVGGVVDMVSGGVRQVSEGARWFANAVLTESDAQSLAGALALLAQNRALVSRMGFEGRAFASRYRKEALVDNVDTLYRELLQARREQQV
jgi:glycosyltransferase involved in cell wall biosynthesis